MANGTTRSIQATNVSCMSAPPRDCTAPVGLNVHRWRVFSRGGCGGRHALRGGLGGTPPSGRGRGRTLQQFLNYSGIFLVETESGRPGGMLQRSCRFCQGLFLPGRFHAEQTVCTTAECRQRRRREYHRHKVVADSVYRQVCNDSSHKWRAENPGCWKRCREAHPDKAARNRTLQQIRDQKRRLRDLANNNLALDLKSCAAGVWLFGPAAGHLANNPLATTQVFIVEGLSQRPRHLANNNALASAPVLPENGISPQPC